MSYDANGNLTKVTVNRYAYVQGDPINRIDPTGQSTIELFQKLRDYEPNQIVNATLPGPRVGKTPPSASGSQRSKNNSYISVNVTLGRDIIQHSAVGGAAALTIDSKSNIYVSVGFTGGISAPSPISPFSVTASKGTIHSKIPASEFLPGWSLSSGFTAGVGGIGQIQGASGFATEYVIGVPQTGSI